MRVAQQVLALFAFSVLTQIAVAAAVPNGFARFAPYQSWLLNAAGLTGSAGGPFLIGGVIPVLIWAFKRFSRDAANGVMIAWGMLIAVFAYFQYYGLAP